MFGFQGAKMQFLPESTERMSVGHSLVQNIEFVSPGIFRT